MVNTFTSYSLITRDIGKSIDRVEKQPLVDRETKYYLDNISKVKSIDEFVKNDRLFKYAMKAHGLEDMAYAKAFMVKVLKEGVSSADSFANKLTDKRYAEFATTYNFQRHGASATSYSRAVNDAPKNFSTQVDLAFMQQGLDFVENEVTNYIAKIGGVQSIDDLMADSRLLYVAMGAFGLDATKETPERIREMLEGGVSDPESPANKLVDKRYANFVTAFNFVEHGVQTTTRDTVQNLVPGQFMQNTGLATIKPHSEFIKAEADYYKANIGKVKTIDTLIADKRLLRVAMSAYGLNADAESPTRVREMLAGGVSDPSSPANKLVDKSYAAFVTAFNFVEHGETTTTRDAVQKDTLKLYTMKSEIGLIKPDPDYIAAETNYYLTTVVKLESIDDLMADKRLLNFALASYGLDPAAESPERIRQMLEGGVTDPKSPANLDANKSYAAFVTAFNFAEHGEAATTFNPARQPAVDKYMRQTLEEDAGKQNEGVRLALYFERKASTIDNFYEVLADPALARVVRTYLNLPDSFAKADIDKQVKLFSEKIDIEDFSSPEKLDKFLKRFTSLWEVNNPTSTAQSSVSVLFAQPTTVGVSTDLMIAMQKLRR